MERYVDWPEQELTIRINGQDLDLLAYVDDLAIVTKSWTKMQIWDEELSNGNLDISQEKSKTMTLGDGEQVPEDHPYEICGAPGDEGIMLICGDERGAKGCAKGFHI